MRHILSLRRHQEVKGVGIVLLAVVLVMGMTSYPVAADTVPVHILRVDGIILPEVVDSIDAGITEAEEANAAICVIELNTPGGLLDATAKIVSRIMDAEVPIVVYVSPVGAWAGGTGTFITIAAHIAAMAPGTAIGAATPVADREIVEDTASWMRGIAEERDRNIEEAELTVTEGKSFSSTEALEHHLVDLRADNLEDLLSQINGWRVVIKGGEVTIDTTHYVLVEHESFIKLDNRALIGGVLAAVVAMGLAILFLRRRRRMAA